MKTAKKVKCIVQQSLKPLLYVIPNKGVVVNNSKLPTGCRYCELKWEQSSW